MKKIEYFASNYGIITGIKIKQGIASDTIPSHCTILLVSLLDGYAFANIHVKGIVAFKHLKNKKKL